MSGVAKRYSDDTQALDDVTLAVAEGEFVSIVGQSGCTALAGW